MWCDECVYLKITSLKFIAMSVKDYIPQIYSNEHLTSQHSLMDSNSICTDIVKNEKERTIVHDSMCIVTDMVMDPDMKTFIFDWIIAIYAIPYGLT